MPELEYTLISSFGWQEKTKRFSRQLKMDECVKLEEENV